MQFANRFKYMISYTASYTEPTFSSERQLSPPPSSPNPPQTSQISCPLQTLDQVEIVGTVYHRCDQAAECGCVHGIILEKIFLVIMGPPSGPDTGLFKRFKSHWHQMSMVKYKLGIDDADVARDLANMTGNIEFCLQQLQEFSLGRITGSCWNLPSFSLGNSS